MAQVNYNLHLKGFVGGADFDRNYVDYVLAKHNDKPVAVLIDSLGGSLATALSIASAFRNHGDVSVQFVGMNASAATIASLGAKHIGIDANAMYLVHKCSTEFFRWCSLNADNMQSLINDLEAQKADLDKLDLNIASMYAKRCKKNQQDLLDLMAKGGWLSAQEALDWGFVDEITNSDSVAPKLTDAMASAMAQVGMPIPNIPLQDKESAFAKFVASITSLFKSNDTEHSTNPITMNKEYAFIGSLLDSQQIAFADGVTTLSAEQLDKIEAEFKRLNDRIDALASAPADNSTNVIENGKSADVTEKSDVEQYFDTCNSARELFNLV